MLFRYDLATPGRALDHLYAPLEMVLDPGEKWASVALIRPQMREARKSLALLGQHQSGAFTISHIGFVNHDLEDQPERIHKQMSFPSIYFFASIIAMWTTLFRGFYRLAVDNRRARSSFSTCTGSDLLSQSRMNPL